MRECYIDLASMTIKVTRAFMDKVQDTTSSQYKLMNKYKKDFPGLEVVYCFRRRSNKPKKNKRLSYKHMEKYFETFDNVEEIKAYYKLVRKQSLVQKSPFKYVSDWFRAQFPDYMEIPTSDSFGTVVLLKWDDIPNITDSDSKPNPDLLGDSESEIQKAS